MNKKTYITIASVLLISICTYAYQMYISVNSDTGEVYPATIESRLVKADIALQPTGIIALAFENGWSIVQTPTGLEIISPYGSFTFTYLFPDMDTSSFPTTDVSWMTAFDPPVSTNAASTNTPEIAEWH